jgi:hypothetical protein
MGPIFFIIQDGVDWARCSHTIPNNSQEIAMMLVKEFPIKDSHGHTLMLQKIEKGQSFIDQGMTRLPRSFQGYSVKFTDQIAEPIEDDDHFKVSGFEGEVFERA